MFQHSAKEAVCKHYLSALEDLIFNNKYYINMLTELAKMNVYFAKDIVAIVEAHLVKVSATEKLPVLYLVDSIVKNLKGDYLVEFAENIAITFVSVFEQVDPDTREELSRLRSTWDDVFPLETLQALDMRVKCVDPNWPMESVQPPVDSSFSLNPNPQQSAASQLGSEMRERAVGQKQHLDKALVEYGKEAELNQELSCAGSEDGDSGRAGQLEREGGGLKPGPINKEKQVSSRYPSPLLPLLKITESRGLESRAGRSSSSSAKRRNRKRAAKVRGGKIIPRNASGTRSVTGLLPLEGTKDQHPKQPGQSLSQVKLDAHSTKPSGPLCQRCPPWLYPPANPQNPRANFNGLPVAGTPTISYSQRMPLARFDGLGTLAPSAGYANAVLSAGSACEGMNARPGFGMTRPAGPSFSQLQPFIASAHNSAPNPTGLQIGSRASHPGQMNVNNLVTRLMSSGLIKPTVTAAAPAFKAEPVSEKQEKERVQKVPDLTGFVREQMKQRYDGVVSELYAGRQCSSCGLRFGGSSQAQDYREHLDWHYRQNRARKDSRKRGAHRGWYPQERDWSERDDAANLDGRAKKSRFFEREQEEKMQGTQEERQTELHSVRAAVDVVNESCEICRELFDLTWEDEREQWCLRNAIRLDGKIYHPSCYEDYKNTL